MKVPQKKNHEGYTPILFLGYICTIFFLLVENNRKNKNTLKI